MFYCCSVCFFKQKTAYDMRISDWSSDVCSSDLRADEEEDQDDGDRCQNGPVEGAAALFRRIAGEQALRRILVETRIRRVDQDHPRHCRQNRKGRDEVERPVKEARKSKRLNSSH